MNLVKLQDTKLTYKNQFHFYTIINYARRKLRKSNLQERIKYLEINVPEDEIFVH